MRFKSNGPHTLTRTPSANADAPATLSPWNTKSPSRPQPHAPRHRAPRPHGPHRRPCAVRLLKAGGCFSRAQNLEQSFVAGTNPPATTTRRNNLAQRHRVAKQPPGPQHPPRRQATRTCGRSGGVQERGKAQWGRETSWNTVWRNGGPGWIRTINPTIMSRLLCP